jgi:hypothetical protein
VVIFEQTLRFEQDAAAKVPSIEKNGGNAGAEFALFPAAAALPQ